MDGTEAIVIVPFSPPKLCSPYLYCTILFSGLTDVYLSNSF